MDFLSPWIHTTERCNLRCHYCYVRGDAVMSPKVYGGLRWLLTRTKETPIHLRFAGGEPLLVFDMWEPFARWMLDYHRDVTAEVLTNFRVVPESFWKFAELPRVNVSVSIDNGDKVKVLDKEIVEKTARLKNPWIMTTITKENIEKLDTLAAFIGMNNYGWCLTTDYFEATTPPWEELAIKLLEVVEILKQFNYDFTRISFNNFSVKSGFSGCRAGDEMFTVACNGDIYKCQTLIGKGKKIGDVWSGYKRTTPPVRKLCEECSIYGYCKGWCPIYYKVPHPICNVIKLFAKEVITEVANAERLPMQHSVRC